MDRWDKYFMRQAREASLMSKDPSTKIGAVLVKDRNIKGTGFNGFPRGVSDDARLLHQSTKYPLIIHAEMNALIDAGHDARGSTLYMYGIAATPCVNCTKHLIQAGVVKVYVAGKPLPERWAEEVGHASCILEEVGIVSISLDCDDLEW
jgi:dCMP deaminase